MSGPDNFVLKAPHDYAIYLPAVNPEYADVINVSRNSSLSNPTGFTAQDLEFWSGCSSLWNHKYVLHSIGGYKVKTDPRGSLFSRKRGSFGVVGDSGGFQIGKGSMKGLVNLKAGMSGNAAVAEWQSNYESKLWIIDTLEQYCDYAMTIDMPLWASLPGCEASPFHLCSEEQLLSMTLENLALITDERRGRTKWLNIVQGTNPTNTMTWWNAVKQYKFDGWSMAGSAGWRGGLYNMLGIMLTMNDEGAFESGMDWIHVLGVSQPKWDVFLTAIQRELRRKNPIVQISCDSASPFITAGKLDQYASPPVLDDDVRSWAIKYQTLPATRSYSDPSRSQPTQLNSPIGSHLLMHHLVVSRDEFAGRRIDLLTNMILANHNTWILLDAGRRANQLAFGSGPNAIPRAYADAIDVIRDVFSRSSWKSVLEKNKDVLDKAAPSKYVLSNDEC